MQIMYDNLYSEKTTTKFQKRKDIKNMLMLICSLFLQTKTNKKKLLLFFSLQLCSFLEPLPTQTQIVVRD